MKKLSMILLAAAAIVSAACQKEIQAPKDSESSVLIEKTFQVSMPGDATRTYLDGMSVKWSDGDEIKVIAATSGNQYTFSLKDGANTTSATFTGLIDEADASETDFYAVYPNVDIRKDSFLNDDVIEFDKSLGDTQSAVEDGFDPKFAPMTAELENGVFDFKHGAAFFKVTIGVDNVAKLTLKTGNTRFQGRPVYNLDGSYNNINGAKDNISLAPAGSSTVLTKGATYYIPVLCKNSTLSTLTLTYEFSDASTVSIETNAKSGVKLELGKVYNLGTPDPTAPAMTLKVTSVDNLPAAAATGLKIAAAAEWSNCTISDITVTYDGTVVTGASLDPASIGDILYDISENTGSARQGWIGLNLAGKPVKKITVGQLAPGAATTLVPVTAATTWGHDFFNALVTEKGTGEVTANFLSGNMKFIAGGSKFKFNIDPVGTENLARVQLGGTGAAGTKACLQIMVAGSGKLKIKAASSGSATRTLNVALNTTVKGSMTVPVKGSVDEQEFTISASANDLINIYSGGSAINVYEITWTPD